ncbi:hypothetical protein [Paenarthrobacter aurescens]|uniref:Lipoprotein n=1 Tax=Paenarthrobacter aurescens TaxID=43663 RepID=A0A4Y3NAA4_PAEAU|nr:hypothetical protein [Paenarthrobacter aurescens]MDO6144483.1 hypothetical protein [Paenarthrobacter aurescens]MDO6148330.1 hypothetical protein [Paenarthrobacter aurescens]MDO6159574.1 hypothetical protein [Paenarthrobacter aurescens]MDO6163557.1 hypothetical protein [Paenarthrobacter aurescens]GEB18047.1 hypothetical protein AAU01_08020 [Paenarthrobacter aurescens]
MKVSTHAVLLLAGAMVLAGCAGSPGGTPIEPPEPTATKTQEDPMNGELTWQEAKAKAQAMELEIAALIPQDTVVSIDQKTKGVLLSCNKTQHRWKGSTTITVADGTKIESIVKDVEAHYRANGLKVSVDMDIDEKLLVQIDPPAPGENYLVGGGVKPNEIWIDSGSPCFTLPEGIYPGGDF